MACSVTNEYGQINISNEVLSMLAGAAATKCFGVVGMASHNIRDGIGSLLKMDSITKGVEIETKDNSLTIKVHIIVGYGMKISVIAGNVMQSIRYAVELATDQKVDQVQVIVQDVRVID